LGALVLAADHSIGRHVGNTYRRIRGVDVLTTGSGGAVGVDTQIRRVDLDLDVVIDFGRDEHGGKGGVAAVAGVVRALAHQPVHTDLGTQPAVGVFTLDVDGGALDARNFTGSQFHDGRFKAVMIGPAQIHAQQHVGPVLGFGATGARLN